MRDPLMVATAGRLSVACQIIHVEHCPDRTWVDLVTLEPCDRQVYRLPAGAPLALGFDCPPGNDFQAELEAVMSYWEESGAVLDLTVVELPDGLSYRFSCGDEHLAVLVGRAD